jgi:GNAT superfamily N-acetyltransferase
MANTTPGSAIALEDSPPSAWIEMIQSGIDQHNMDESGFAEHHPVNLFATDSTGDFLGGLLGTIWGGWLHIESLWIRAEHRGQGYGDRLLFDAEACAMAKGCVGAALDTHSAKAKSFYEKRGYQVFGEIQGFPTGGAKFFLRKKLRKS